MRTHVRAVLAVLLLAIMTSASAQDDLFAGTADPVHSPSIAVLVHHPVPDDSDPLGVEYLETGTDAYWQRYKHLDTDGYAGFDYPHTVFDGTVAIEGIPDGEGPYVATQEAYQSAYASRTDEEAPLQITLSSREIQGRAIEVLMQLNHSADLGGEDLHLWVAAVEDPVDYEPPQALSNGVFVHPFVVRAVQDLGPAEPRAYGTRFSPVVGDGPEAWDPDKVRIVAWVQQGPSEGLRFDAHEVVQALMEVPDVDAPTTATEKVVLMEMYSATWCDTCLFGDRVAEEMAVQYGVERRSEAEGSGYLRDGPWAIAVLVGVVAAAVVALPRLPGGGGRQ